MRHVCEPLSFNKLENTFNGQALNISIINMIKLRDELSSCYDDRLLEQCDLLVSREHDTRFAPTLGATRVGVRACNQDLCQR